MNMNEHFGLYFWRTLPSNSSCAPQRCYMEQRLAAGQCKTLPAASNITLTCTEQKLCPEAFYSPWILFSALIHTSLSNEDQKEELPPPQGT